MFSYSFDSLFASFLWKYPNSNTLMERRASIRFCNFATPSVVGWTSIACCAPSIKREMRKYFQFSIRRSQTLIIIPAEQSRTFIMLRNLSFAPESWRQIQDMVVWHQVLCIYITQLHIFYSLKFVKNWWFKWPNRVDISTYACIIGVKVEYLGFSHSRKVGHFAWKILAVHEVRIPQRTSSALQFDNFITWFYQLKICNHRSRPCLDWACDERGRLCALGVCAAARPEP